MAGFIRNRITWLTYLVLAFYAYFLNSLGPITPFLKDDLKLSYTVSSLHFTAFAVGILCIGLGGHVVIRRLGRWNSLWIGAGGISLGALLLLAGRTPLITISASFLMGLVGSLILAITPAMLSDQYGKQRAVAISEANVVSSLVSSAAPLIIGWAAQFAGSWRLAFGIAAFTPLVMRLGFRGVSLPQPAVHDDGPNQVSQPLPMRYWIIWTAIVFSVSVEFCMVFWSADYVENGLGMLKANAAQSVSLFLAGMILGRLACSHLVRLFSTQKVIAGSILIAGAGFLAFWQGRSILVGLAGLFITGLGVASLYPLTLSLAISTAKNNSDQASARATLASGTAILVLPLVLGRLADAFGIRLAYGVVALLLVLVFLITWFSARLSPAPQPAAG